MTHREVDSVYAMRLAKGLRVAVKLEVWYAGRAAKDFNVFPADSLAIARAQGLEESLLSCETYRKMG